ncbi:MAG: hypothetical protein QOI10_2207 [Solirubrobacterales bacterium]|nr:hypothetical protein [Solirubrobacterales bacterium]
MMHTDTGELIWSRNMFRIFGVDPAAGVPNEERRAELIHPDDRERRLREIKRVRNGATEQSFDFRIVHSDGTIRHLYSTIAVIEEGAGQPRRVVGCVQDLTSTRLADREIAVHLATVEALHEDSPDHGVDSLLRRLARAMGCSYAVLWAPGDDGLVARATWISAVLTAGNPELAQDEPLDRSAAPVVLEAISRRAPVVENGWGTNNTDPTGRKKLGFASTVAFPALAGDEVLATLEFRSRETIELSERFARSLIGVGHELGAYFAHHTTELRAPTLTPRELQVLQRAADGGSGPAIAEALEISPATVKSHFEHVYAKLGVADRASAVAVALRNGLFK